MPYGLLVSHALVLGIATLVLRADSKPPMALTLFAAMRIDGVLFLAVTPAFYLSGTPPSGFACLWSALILLVAGALLYDRETQRLAWLGLLTRPDAQPEADGAVACQAPQPRPLPPGPLPSNVIPFRRRR